ncbi:MAG: nickel-dependent lactate racemase [Desulfobacterales bacterium]
MKPCELKYGNTSIAFELPDHADSYAVREPKKTVTPSGFARSLTAALERRKPKLSNTVIALADKTRLCDYAQYLPVLLKTLTRFGANPSRITLHIAYGTHARQSESESLQLYGDSYGKYRFVHHDCTDEVRFVFRGITRRRTKLMLLREVEEADFLITFGAISHHYFAGYGGGRKLIFPGLGFQKSIWHNHSLFLDREKRTLSPLCQPGILDGNPLAEDLADVEKARPADLSVHGILNSAGQVCKLFVGSGTAHFRRACAEHGKNCEVSTARLYDLVIASCGGYPKDINFIQSHKAVHNASKFVRDGGELIVLAQCGEGIGSKTFLPWFEMGGFDAAFDRLAEKYEGNGGTALSMMEKTARIRISLVTELPEAMTEIMGVRKITAEQAVRRVKECSGSLALIPSAGLVVKK